jgi:iron complex outermembrane receptor protein
MTNHVPASRVRAGLVAAAAACLCASAAAQTMGTLPEVRVLATRFPEPEQPLPFGVTTITADEIRASGVTSVNEALMRLAGVVGRQDLYGGGEYNLDLRGFGTTADVNQVVILDGVRLSEADLGGTRLAGIPIESVERIEVLRGAGAVLYGEGATGGVIVITTKAGAGRVLPTGGDVYAVTGSHGLRELRADGTVSAADGFSLDAHAQERKSNGFRANSATDANAESVTGQWANDWLRVGARLAHDELEARLPGALSAAQYAADPTQATTPNDRASIRNDREGVFARATLGAWDLALDAGHREKELRSLNAGFPFDYDIHADSYALRARREGSIGGLRNDLVVGSDVDQWRRQILGDFGSSATQHSTAFYAKDDVTLAGGTRISAGARTQGIHKDNTASNNGLSDRAKAWELGVSQPLAAAWTVYARVGRSFRLPNADEFSFTSPGVTLVPQVSHDTEIGTRWNYGKGKLDARLYRSNLTNEIGFDPNAVGAFGLNGANVNFDPTRRQGLEVDWTHALNASLGVRASAAWREATFRSGPYAGKDVPLAPRRTAAVHADWTVVPGQHASGGFVWVSTQHPDFANTCTMPSYVTADARYAWQVLRNTELALGVTNLFDRKFYTQAFGCVNGQTTSIYPEAGRQLTASMRVQF